MIYRSLRTVPVVEFFQRPFAPLRGYLSTVVTSKVPSFRTRVNLLPITREYTPSPDAAR